MWWLGRRKVVFGLEKCCSGYKKSAILGGKSGPSLSREGAILSVTLNISSFFIRSNSSEHWKPAFQSSEIILFRPILQKYLNLNCEGDKFFMKTCRYRQKELSLYRKNEIKLCRY